MAIAEEAASFNAVLAESTAALEGEYDVLRDDVRLPRLAQHEVQAKWQLVYETMPKRARWIHELSMHFERVEARAVSAVKAGLQKEAAAMLDAAYVGPGDVERIAEQQAEAFNNEALRVRRELADLVHRLRISEVEFEHARREQWEARFARWRELRAESVVAHFCDRMAARAHDPPTATALFLDEEHVSDSS